MMRFFFLFLVLWSALVVEADRRGSRPMVTSPFSTSEQALFGQSHTEDCLFGSSHSAFFEPDDDLDEVKEVKSTSSKPAEPEKSSKKLSFTSVPKPAFLEKP